mmetsp:Transcript_59599/g.174340  ORF Transcript_59599/g.174340 Transcript_59599/m.174340 type:complete len:250 (-) Transcript_59599:1946-2695(-)
MNTRLRHKIPSASSQPESPVIIRTSLCVQVCAYAARWPKALTSNLCGPITTSSSRLRRLHGQLRISSGPAEKEPKEYRIVPGAWSRRRGGSLAPLRPPCPHGARARTISKGSPSRAGAARGGPGAGAGVAARPLARLCAALGPHRPRLLLRGAGGGLVPGGRCPRRRLQTLLALLPREWGAWPDSALAARAPPASDRRLRERASLPLPQSRRRRDRSSLRPSGSPPQSALAEGQAAAPPCSQCKAGSGA